MGKWLRTTRGCLREAVYAAAYATGAAWLIRRLAGPRRLILSYHNVLPAGTFDPRRAVHRVDMTRETFVAQIEYLARRGEIRPAAQLADGTPGVFLTFDDGLLNQYELVLPVLDRLGLTGVFAVCPGLIEGEVPHIWREHFALLLRAMEGREALLPMDDFARPTAVSQANAEALLAAFTSWAGQSRRDVYEALRKMCSHNGTPYCRLADDPLRFRPMSWEMLADLQRRGHIIASHGWSHRPLSWLRSLELWAELRRSRQALRRRLGGPADWIVYPYGTGGEVDADVMSAAAGAGYRVGLLNVPYALEGEAGMNLPRRTAPSRGSRRHVWAVLSGLNQWARPRQAAALTFYPETPHEFVKRPTHPRRHLPLGAGGKPVSAALRRRRPAGGRPSHGNPPADVLPPAPGPGPGD